MSGNGNRDSRRPSTWAEVDAIVRANVHDMLRGQVLAAKDQAERFRDPESKHRDEAIAREWDWNARIYSDALEVLKTLAFRRPARRKKR